MNVELFCMLKRKWYRLDRITPSMLAASIMCPREAWFMSRAILPEEDNYFLSIGRLIHEESYISMQIRDVEIDGAKIDFVVEKNGETVVAEIKKSSRSLESGRIQLLYYMKKLKEISIDVKGQLRVPSEKKIIDVYIDDENEKLLEEKIQNLRKIISLSKPPKITTSNYCKKCGFQSLCFS